MEDEIPCWSPMGIAGQADSPLVLTLVLSTAIVVPSLPSLLSGLSLPDEWRARFFDTFEIYRPSVRERGSAGEREHKGGGVKEGRKAFDVSNAEWIRVRSLIYLC